MSIKVNKNLVPSGKHNIKCPYAMDAEFITYHNTANDATAKNEISYMVNNNNQVSYHYAVDDKEVWQGVAVNRNAWHCGDGGSGSGNRKSIGVEVCYSKSGGDKYYNAEKLANKFIAQLLHERGWGVSRVKKHQDWSGKYCPHRVLDEGRWDGVLDEIQDELDKLNGKKVEKPKKEKIKSETVKKPSNKKGDMKTGSIVTYLNSIGADSSYSNRAKLAAKNGIKNYKGLASQNTQLLGKLRGDVKSTPKKSKSKPNDFNLPNATYWVKSPQFHGSGVLAVQKALSSIYFYPEKGARNNGCDSYYGSKTANAVKRFQSMYGLKEDGSYGKKTKEKLIEVLNK